MFPPLLKLIINEPALLGEHINAYSDLLATELAHWQRQFQHRLLFNLALVAGVLTSVLLAGIALMLWAVTGTGHWLLVVVPLLPLALTGTAYACRREADGETFAVFRAQLRADIRMLKQEMRNE